MTNCNFSKQTEPGQNRSQILALALAISVCLLFALPLVISSAYKQSQPCKIQLNNQINPNIASQESLERMPGLGLSRASAIIAYREKFSYGESNVAFLNCTDLQKVKGIGPKTAQKICKWLKFE